MLKKVTQSDISLLNIPDVTFNPIFIDISCQSTGANAVYYIYYKNQSPIIAFALFERYNKIITPTHGYPFYSGIWFIDKKDYDIDLSDALHLLTEKYKSISLILPPKIDDIRSFIWNGFKIINRYTYIKNCNDLSVKYDVKKNYKKAEKLNFNLTIEESLGNEWINYKNLLLRIGYNSKYLISLETWINSLLKKKLVKFFKVSNSDKETLGSGIVLLNDASKKGYFLLSFVDKSNIQSEINSFLYIKIQKWLLENGFEFFDYLGANTKSIAEFKKRFNPKLQQYYIAKYSRSYNLSSSIKKWFKKVIIFFNI
ncbi:hypothetical protein [Pedobacter alpinus]|uniref:BioF2-like acetyltransferase domain-containing protein n=1 Tax=Pedobacter alpinus TaxID=1590643 RepID=A0ABW5TV42_9SPHI